MMMPGREYQAQPSRFGFNGKENDNDVKGFGNQQDYGMRIYDTRVGKFLSVDPLQKKFASLTPYQFASNTPIQAIDLDGLESVKINTNEIDNTLNPASTKDVNNDIHKKDIQPWMDLLTFKVPSSQILEMRSRKGLKYAEIQDIADARSDETNFDYFSLTITKLPTGFTNHKDLFEYLRINFNDFLPSRSSFLGYNKNEKEKWESSNPLGAVMSFDQSMFGSPGWAKSVSNYDDASVFTSSYKNGDNSSYWTFSTASTPGGDWGHPVSGTRQFGITLNKSTAGDTYTFFIRAADRVHAEIDILGGGSAENIFLTAKRVWDQVIGNIGSFINSNGGQANPNTPVSKRLSWEKDVPHVKKPYVEKPYPPR